MLQFKNLRDITTAGGTSLVINETNLQDLQEALNAIDQGYEPRSNYKLFEPKQTETN
jgi:hypothetical protein